MVDWQAEGLLVGLDQGTCAGRIELLDLLHASGASVAELKQAVAQDRLALLPVERALAGVAHYTVTELARQADLDREFLLEYLQALGLPVPLSGEVVFTEEDVRAARSVGLFRHAGLPDDGLLEVARVLSDAMAHAAEAIRRLVGEAFIRAGDTEHEVGMRYERAARELMPLLSPLLQYLLNIHMRELVRRDVVGRAERASGHLSGTVNIGVAFADLVGFTRLGERVASEELGNVATRLARLGRQVAQPPVRLVKTVGDAVMLVSPEAAPLVDAALRLVDAVEGEQDLPALHVGMAWGPAINRWGDWYGSAVNIASRITSRARPGSVLVTKQLRESAGEGYSWSRAGSHHFRGVSERVSLYRVRLRATRDLGEPLGT
jgi:adenylate cyclase